LELKMDWHYWGVWKIQRSK